MIGIVNPKTGILLYYSNNWKEGLNEMKKALQRFGAKLFMKSDPAGTRTQGPRLKRPLLYQLSY
jgi:hypothetical protein